MSLARRILVATAGAFALAALAAGPAGADNRRVGIGDYTWTDIDIEIDLNEHVTWYWVGPDTVHSITGDNDKAEGIDSDPDTNQPYHDIGDSFRLDFSSAGTYSFRCKLHSTVRGEVTVSDTPGDPVSEPDPIPQTQLDLKAPRVDGPILRSSSFGRRGTAMHYSLSEKARISADLYLLRPGKSPKYSGYVNYRGGHIGFNNVRFGKRSKHFKAKPGKYRADVIATDQASNTTRPVKLKFSIYPR